MFFNTDKNNRKDFNQGYILGSLFPMENLPKIKEKILKMRESKSNLKKYKALIQGFLLGVQDRRKARLEELERVKQKPSKGISRER